MTQRKLYIGADSLVQLDELTDEADASVITDATATWNLKDDEGTSLCTGSLSHTSAGRYQGVIDKAAPSPALTFNQTCYLEITTASAGRDGFWRIPMVAVYHEG